MTRGRKRKFNPLIPGHIDQDALPRGIYWADGRWYTLEQQAGAPRPVKVTVAHRASKLSDLHALMEERRTGQRPGTVRYLFDSFHASSEYRELSMLTQRDYTRYAETLANYVRKDGSLFGSVQIDRITTPVVQRLVESFAAGRPANRFQPELPPTPSKANHLYRYLRRTLAWGVRHGHNKTNPAEGVRQAKERRQFKMPTPEAYAAVIAFARERGALTPHTKGSMAPYLAPAMVLAYNLRLRGIEVCTLTDANHFDDGIRSNRRKGSRDNLTLWNQDMRQAWQELANRRSQIWNRPGRAMPIPLRAEDRYLLVTQSGQRMQKSSLDTRWQKLIIEAIECGIITEEQRFSLHGLKHRGITDSDDKASGGHKSEAMRQLYDHDVPRVEPPRKR